MFGGAVLGVVGATGGESRGLVPAAARAPPLGRSAAITGSSLMIDGKTLVMILRVVIMGRLTASRNATCQLQ